MLLVRQVWRHLRRDAFYASLAALTMTLAIAGTSAAVAIVYAVVLHPLPYPDSDRLVVVAEARQGDGQALSVSVPDYFDWHGQAKSLDRLAAAWTGLDVNLEGLDQPARLRAARVAHGFFEVFGLRFALGRAFSADEDQPGANRTAVITHDLWTREFSADASITRRHVTLDGVPTLVTGVLGRGEALPIADVDVLLPLRMNSGSQSPFARFLQVFGRLAPGGTIDAARSEFALLARRAAEVRPESNTAIGATVDPLHATVVAGTTGVLGLILVAAGAVLVIASVNVVNLGLVRLTERRRGVAVQLALGATPFEVGAVFLLEALLLVGASGVAGVALAAGALRAFVALAPASIPRLGEVRLEPVSILVSAGVVVLAAVLVGLAPAWLARRTSVLEVIGTGRSSVDAGKARRMTHAFVISQIGLAVAVVALAGLLSGAYSRLAAVPTGFDPDQVVAVFVSVRGPAYRAPESQSALYDTLVERVRALPDVLGASAVSRLPLDAGGTTWTYVTPTMASVAPGTEPTARYYVVGDGYFGAMGVPIIAGRALDRRDQGPESTSIVISEALANARWPGARAVGQRLKLGRADSDNPWLTVVGVAGGVRDVSLTAAAGDAIYQAYSPTIRASGPLVIRSRSAADAVVRSVRAAVAEVDRGLPVYDVRRLDTLVDLALRAPRFNAWAFGSFAMVALVLAAVGVFGVAAQAVNQQRRTIALSSALGATPRRVLVGVLGGVGRLTLVGIGIGAAVAWLVSTLAAGVFDAVAGPDPIGLAASCGIFLVVAIAACVLPARRALRVDPALMLKDF